jgi:hypothetical protein
MAMNTAAKSAMNRAEMSVDYKREIRKLTNRLFKKTWNVELKNKIK